MRIDVESVYRYLDPTGSELDAQDEKKGDNFSVLDALRSLGLQMSDLNDMDAEEDGLDTDSLVIALSRLLLKKGIITQEELDQEMEFLSQEEG